MAQQALFPNLPKDKEAALNDPTGGKFDYHKAAGMWIVAVDDKGDIWGLFVRQHKQSKDTKQWNNTISIPSGKAAQRPDKTNKKTGKPFAEKGTPEYDEMLKLHEAEKHAPLLTAVREVSEETGAPPEVLRAKFNEHSLVLLNNGYVRFMNDPQNYEDYKAKKKDGPFIVCTYVTLQKGGMEEEQKSFVPSDETSSAFWVRLTDMFPDKKKNPQEFAAFHENVYVKNQNYSLPPSCPTIPPRNPDEDYSVASYIARTIVNDLDTVRAAAEKFKQK